MYRNISSEEIPVHCTYSVDSLRGAGAVGRGLRGGEGALPVRGARVLVVHRAARAHRPGLLSEERRDQVEPKQYHPGVHNYKTLWLYENDGNTSQSQTTDRFLFTSRSNRCSQVTQNKSMQQTAQQQQSVTVASNQKETGWSPLNAFLNNSAQNIL